jgi:hypothetical protein
MKSLPAVVSLLLLAPVLVPAHAKSKKPYKLPAIFNQATYVYVEAIDGQQFDPRLYPEDRQAIANVQSTLEDWHRYVLTVKRDDAELIFVVRKGREAEERVGIQAGTPPLGAPGRPQNNPNNPSGPNNPNGSGGPGVVATSVAGEVGTPNDLLEVYYKSPDHAHGMMIWQRTEADGLDRPDVTLIRELKDEVERTYPIQTASQTKKP